jgi:hypothetical protein
MGICDGCISGLKYRPLAKSYHGRYYKRPQKAIFCKKLNKNVDREKCGFFANNTLLVIKHKDFIQKLN